MGALRSLTKKDLPRWAFWGLAAGIVLAKVLLAKMSYLYTWAQGAPIDDGLMWRAAQYISAGQWLGPYDYLTLSKQMFFAVWLALCNAVGVPYLVAGQLLCCGAALAMAQAFAPVLQKRWMRFVLFAALALNPAAAAAFTLRIYRDNIFPSLCTLFFAGMIGCALRYDRGLRHYGLWLVLAGLGLGTAYITREDGVWLLPFAVLGSGITAAYILLNKGLGKKALRCAVLAVPYAMLAAALLAMSAMNYKYYGVFTTSDFSAGSFADAYGAMTRVQHAEGDDPLLPVPESVRLQLYEAAPALAPLRPWLEAYQPFHNAYHNKELKDYAAGSFYWALRRAAQETGVYADARTAAAYWQTVAEQINAAIDAGVLQAAAGPRSSTAPIIRGVWVAPAVQEALHSFVYCATFRDCSCWFVDTPSSATADEAAARQAYLGSPVSYAAVEHSNEIYYPGANKLVYRCFDLLVPVYAVLGPVLLAAALAWLAGAACRMIKQRTAAGLLPWLILFGVLGMAIFRCGMIAFMEVAAFRIGTYVMYLATVHPLLITFGVAGSLQWHRQ